MARMLRSVPDYGVKRRMDEPTMSVVRACGAALLALLLVGCGETQAPGDDARADPRRAETVALGERVYRRECAACHGAQLEGQPNWRQRLPNGRLPAPPHDASGHTWHHADLVLFGITKRGLVQPYAPKGYESDMPVYAGRLSDEEIWAVLAYIKSRWPKEILAARAQMLRQR